MAGKKTRIMFMELKAGYGDRGPARIGRVRFSQTGRTLYYRDKRFQSCGGQGIAGNYFDVDTGAEYWISGPKKNGHDRHWAAPARSKSTQTLPTSIGETFVVKASQPSSAHRNYLPIAE